MDAAQNAYDVTTPLLRLVPQTALDSVFGASALVSPDLKLSVVGRSWDEFMARSGRSDLTRNALLGSTILLFFRNDEQRRVFESLLHSMHSDELGVHNQVVDLGTKEKPFYVQLHVQGLWQEGVFAGYFLHCLDITREHTNRLALIERDRELMAVRESLEKTQQAGNSINDKLRASAEEIAQREAQLRKMTEKSVRLEKSSKEAMERAEKSVEKSVRLQHEIDKLKKQAATSAEAAMQSEAQQAEFIKLQQELAQAQSAAQRFEEELTVLREQHGGQASEVAAAAQELADLRVTVSEFTAQHSAAQAELAGLKEALAASQQEVLELQTAMVELQQVAATAPTPEAAPEPDSAPSVAEEFVQLLAQPACYLDIRGSLLCATGPFWEKLGVAATQAHEQAFTEWLDEESTLNFSTWLAQQADVTCDLTAANGSSWRSCAVVGNDGNWQRVVVEELVLPMPEAIENAPTESADDRVPASGEPTDAAMSGHSQVRVLSRELADEFSNLLTGVLGHASLAAAELDGNTSRDILAIEKTAREAAQLVRKLSALSGAGRHAQESELTALLKQYVKKMPPGTFSERAQLVVCDESCRVAGEANSLRMVLDAVTTHTAERVNGGGQVCYTLSRNEEQVCLAVSYEGSAGYPCGWDEGLPPALGQPGWELIFAREVVRGMGGDLDLSEDGGRAMLLATLPLLPIPVSA
ncbi:MAG: hypothetical protein IPH10_10300 [bacterium]|nr:hypothetical protein [bacterium]